MVTGIPFLDDLTRGVLLLATAASLFEVGVQWFRAAVGHASDDDGWR